MQKINKIFKSLKLKRDEKNKLEFRKREGIHDFKLKTLIQHFIDENVGEKVEEDKSNSENSVSSNDSDSESDRGGRKRKRSRSRSFSSNSSSSSSRSPSSDKGKPQFSKLDALNSKINEMQYQSLQK